MICFNRKDFGPFMSESLCYCLQVPREPAETVRFQRSGVVRALPVAVKCEVALDKLRSQSVSNGIQGEATMVAREADRLYATSVHRLQTRDLKKAYVFKGNWIAGRAGVQHN